MKRSIITTRCCLALLFAIHPATAATTGFCVNDFGARAENDVTNTAAIQKTIDAAAAW